MCICVCMSMFVGVLCYFVYICHKRILCPLFLLVITFMKVTVMSLITFAQPHKHVYKRQCLLCCFFYCYCPFVYSHVCVFPLAYDFQAMFVIFAVDKCLFHFMFHHIYCKSIPKRTLHLCNIHIHASFNINGKKVIYARGCV